MRKPFLYLACLIPLLAGCGGLESTPTSRSVQPTGRTSGGRVPGQTRGRPARVAATRIDYHGWSALKMSNGIVTVVAVPDIGGRILEYKLGGHPFLWANPDEFGKAYDPPTTEQERTWHNFGGYKVWPAPQDRWHGPPDPLGSQLDGGRWQADVGPSAPTAASFKLTSPADKAVTGLQVTREVTLHAGTTRVTVKETFTNVTDEPITWSIWDVTQVPGAVDKRHKFSDKARVYFPLNPQSKFANGFREIVEGGGRQWMPDIAPGIMGVAYAMQQGKIGADSVAGWIAYVDELHEYAYVKRFAVEKGRKYPDEGSTVEVWCSGDLPYMEVEVLSPLTQIEPGNSFSRTIEWYACRCGGPIVACTDVGVVQQPLKIDRGPDKTELSGRFGVFLPGTVEITFQDAKEREISVARSLSVSPDKVLELKQVVTVPEDAHRVVLQVVNEAGTPVGILASAPMEGM
ncbi:MAG: DUF4380 domain-containing protein [Armatimonadota bacterium]